VPSHWDCGCDREGRNEWNRRDAVGVRLDDGLQDRVGAYAGREGLTVGEAISALLYLGLEFAERQRAGLKEDMNDLQREVRDLKMSLGPTLQTRVIASVIKGSSGAIVARVLMRPFASRPRRVEPSASTGRAYPSASP
jgi:hypothetical protein